MKINVKTFSDLGQQRKVLPVRKTFNQNSSFLKRKDVLSPLCDFENMPDPTKTVRLSELLF